jgi:AcrR family transcriptional regulator
MRAGTRRNSARTVSVAQQVFIEDGIDAPLDEIVKRAGIGAGTLYQRCAPTSNRSTCCG